MHSRLELLLNTHGFGHSRLADSSPKRTSGCLPKALEHNHATSVDKRMGSTSTHVHIWLASICPCLLSCVVLAMMLAVIRVEGCRSPVSLMQTFKCSSALSQHDSLRAHPKVVWT